MGKNITAGTGNIPLTFAYKLTERAVKSYESGEMLSLVTPVTADLITHWFSEELSEVRKGYNFHPGQKQAILSAIYAHEALQKESLEDLYKEIDKALISEMAEDYLKKDKYSHPKYCIKMATGTGKTWVLTSLLVWQYLNAKLSNNEKNLFTMNFLVVAPGLIVYDRLLDSFLGRETQPGKRDFSTSDIAAQKDLFLPKSYQETALSFIANNTLRKEEIGSRVTGQGLVALTNWHLFMGNEENEDDFTESEDPQSDITGNDPLEQVARGLREILPLIPGRSGGNSLETLDNQYLSENIIDYFKELNTLCVFNDEAHHIHENKTAGVVSEVEWQLAMNRLSENRGRRFIQIDFSATPYDVQGTGENRTKHFFPHIITDFDLPAAIRMGLVKTVALDRRKEIESIQLDFNAVRDGKKVVGLSDGQRIMLRAGLHKLRILEEQFLSVTKDHYGISAKYPKMLVICEDTTVTPLVEDFLRNEEKLSAEQVIRVDSDRKGSVNEKRWNEIKADLFGIDKKENPKVIISVLMLREGFDVNNICVIVPLRSSKSLILLEQTLGRGLRLMWREPEFQEIKAENRERILVNKQAPENYLDILSVIEHPEFMKFYDELISAGAAGTDAKGPSGGGKDLGDIITVPLRHNYQQYDLYWPEIIREAEEHIEILDALDLTRLEPWNEYSLEQLQGFVSKGGETFVSQDLLVKTRYGEYKVKPDLFTASSYNEFLSRLLNTVGAQIGKISDKGITNIPLIQIQQSRLIGEMDRYIRNRLFGQTFNPVEGENWRILMLAEKGITGHIVQELTRMLFMIMTNSVKEGAQIQKHNFSVITEMRVRENYAAEIRKSIYTKTGYPSNRGDFEKQFMEFCDRDSAVESIIKISEYNHDFASVMYIRNDGILARYFPDFLIRTKTEYFIVETKAAKDKQDPNVIRKQRAAVDLTERLNALNAEQTEGRKWQYLLVTDVLFRDILQKNVSFYDLVRLTNITKNSLDSTLF